MKKKNHQHAEVEGMLPLVFPTMVLMARVLQPKDLPSKVTPQQIRIIMGLHFRGEPIRLSELLRFSNVTQGTMTVAIQKLEKMGMIIKKKDPEDDRAVQLTLSKKAEALAQQVQAGLAANLDAICEDLSAEERRELLHSMEVVFKKFRAYAMVSL